MKLNFLIAMSLTVALWGGAPEALAQCQALPEGAAVPEAIKTGQCLELQGLNTLPRSLVIYGRLIVKAGERADLAEGARLIIKRGGELSIRGTFSAAPKSEIVLEDYATVNSSGEFNLKQDALWSLQRGATVKSIGQIYLYPGSAARLGRDVHLSSSGYFIVDKAALSVEGGVLENSGTWEMREGSSAKFAGNTGFMNSGQLILQQGSTLSLEGRSFLNTKRNLRLWGECQLSDTATLQNNGIFDLHEGGVLRLTGGSTVNNAHVINLLGLMSLSGHTLYENRRNLQIDELGTLRLAQQAKMINRGTVYDQGTVQIGYGDSIVNKHIFFIKEHRVNAADFQNLVVKELRQD